MFLLYCISQGLLHDGYWLLVEADYLGCSVLCFCNGIQASGVIMLEVILGVGLVFVGCVFHSFIAVVLSGS